MKYFEALKIWNVEHNKGTWCVPKKGTAEYDAIKAILAKHNPPKPEAPKKEKKTETVTTVAVVTKEIPEPLMKAIESLRAAALAHKTNPSPDTKTYERSDSKSRHAVSYVTKKVIPETEKKLNKEREKVYKLLDKYKLTEDDIKHLTTQKIEEKKEVKNEIIPPPAAMRSLKEIDSDLSKAVLKQGQIETQENFLKQVLTDVQNKDKVVYRSSADSMKKDTVTKYKINLKDKKENIIKEIQEHLTKLATKKNEAKKEIEKAGKELKELMAKLKINSKDLEELRRRSY